MVLIDSGSTHNFIDSETTRRIGLTIHKEGTLEVMVAKGERVKSSGAARR